MEAALRGWIVLAGVGWEVEFSHAFEGHAFIGDGVVEGEAFGVEAEARRGRAGIERVAEDGVADVETVEAKLIGASGDGRKGEEGATGGAFADMEARLGRAAFVANTPLGAGEAIASDGGVDELFLFGDDARNERRVALFDGAVEKLKGDGVDGAGGFGDDHETGGITVETVWQPDRFGMGRVVEQAVHEGAGAFADGGVDEHAVRLVDDQKVIVFEENVERDGFGGGGEGAWLFGGTARGGFGGGGGGAYRGGRHIFPRMAAWRAPVAVGTLEGRLRQVS